VSARTTLDEVSHEALVGVKCRCHRCVSVREPLGDRRGAVRGGLSKMTWTSSARHVRVDRCVRNANTLG